MKEDIKQRAEEYADSFILAPEGEHYPGLLKGYIAAMTEERERGKRFVQWLFVNDLYFVNDDIFNSFLAEKKELNN